MQPRRRCRAAGLPDLAAWVSWALLALLAFLAFLALGAWSAWLASDAHGAEAVRYRDGQGIEIIGGRASAIPATVAPPVMPVTRSAPLRLQRMQQAEPARLHVTAHEQRARDRDRLAILRQELDAELAAVQENIAHSRGLAHEPLQRSREQLRRHQQNIRDLHAEISRAVKATK